MHGPQNIKNNSHILTLVCDIYYETDSKRNDKLRRCLWQFCKEMEIQLRIFWETEDKGN